MSDSEELKRLQQDVDALSEQVAMLQESLDVRHSEVIARLEVLDETIKSGLEGIEEFMQDDMDDSDFDDELSDEEKETSL